MEELLLVKAGVQEKSLPRVKIISFINIEA